MTPLFQAKQEAAPNAATTQNYQEKHQSWRRKQCVPKSALQGQLFAWLSRSYQSSALTPHTVPSSTFLAVSDVVRLEHPIILHEQGDVDMALDPSNPLFAPAKRG